LLGNAVLLGPPAGLQHARPSAAGIGSNLCKSTSDRCSGRGADPPDELMLEWKPLRVLAGEMTGKAARPGNEPDPQVVLTIQDASRLLQVPAPTIRSWERRYGVPIASRSDGGHRRYTPEQLQMLLQMRDEISRGHRAVQAAALIKAAQTRSTDPLIQPSFTQHITSTLKVLTRSSTPPTKRWVSAVPSMTSCYLPCERSVVGGRPAGVTWHTNTWPPRPRKPGTPRSRHFDEHPGGTGPSSSAAGRVTTTPLAWNRWAHF
jgi:DNA-binding transcriptional MerR regulator